MREPLVILGGGLGGLSVATWLDGAVPVYEQRPTPGGLCAQITVEGFRFDAVPHVLHFQEEALRSWVNGLIGGSLQPYARQARVWTRDHVVRYPFQAHLHGLPTSVIDECLQSRRQARGAKADRGASFDAWLTEAFGDGIAKHFLTPYNEKFWTVPLSELTCEWVDGMVPVPTYDETLRGAATPDPTEYGYNATFWYPHRGGLGAILSALVARVPHLRLGKRLLRLDTASRTLTFADGEMVPCETVVCGIPLPELRHVLHPLPQRIQDAFEALRWTSLAVVHLGVRGEAPVDWDWVYVPDPEMACYRVGFPSRYAPDAAPSGTHLISAECSHPPGATVDVSELTERVVQDLQRMGLLRSAQDVVVRHPIALRYGYVLYDQAYRQARTTLEEYLLEQGVHLVGRFGAWKYLSMEGTLIESQRVAKRLSRVVGHAPISA